MTSTPSYDRNNIAAHLIDKAASDPNKIALIVPAWITYEKLSYGNLYALTLKHMHRLQSEGLKKGDRVLLMVSPGKDFIALVFAILLSGGVAVLIDPGIEKKHLKKAIAHVKPHMFIGILRAHLMRLLWPSSFSSVKRSLFSGLLWTPTWKKDKEPVFPKTDHSDPAAIIFTTGSTGPPKGVVYTHGMFSEQIKTLQKLYGIHSGDVDMPAFPLFALFSVAMGTCCVIPNMNPTRPAQANPKKILYALNTFGVTYTFGSPALWNRVASYCQKKNRPFPAVKKILIAGAPVSDRLLQSLRSICDEQTDIFTPYGATECLPVTSIESREVLSKTAQKTHQGLGICVGRKVEGMQIKIDPIDGKIGEIIVSSPYVTTAYFENSDANKAHKFRGDSGELWHRMGDVGYFDEQGRLWYCGRKSHCFTIGAKTYFTICCEGIFNHHPAVFRSALVQINHSPVIIIETLDQKPSEALTKELLELASKYSVTQNINHVLFHPNFPVDIRHNAKIFREKLTTWAEKKI